VCLANAFYSCKIVDNNNKIDERLVGRIRSCKHIYSNKETQIYAMRVFGDDIPNHVSLVTFFYPFENTRKYGEKVS
jgi:hypothetical protein